MAKNKRSRVPKGTFEKIAVRFWEEGKLVGPYVVKVRVDILIQAQRGSEPDLSHVAKLVTAEARHEGYHGPTLEGTDLYESDLTNYA